MLSVICLDEIFCEFPTVCREVPSERIQGWSRNNGVARLQHAPQKSYPHRRVASCLIRPHFPAGDRLRQ